MKYLTRAHLLFSLLALGACVQAPPAPIAQATGTPAAQLQAPSATAAEVTVAPAAQAPTPGPNQSPGSSNGQSRADGYPDEDVAKWCNELGPALRSFRWKLEGCKFKDWKVGGRSVQNRALVYAEFGDPNSKNTTLVLTMVHGDEITPLYTGLALVNWLAEQKESFAKTAHVVVAPLVNPDGFYRSPRTRMNARGVDVNRNFATRDWNEHALRAWKTKFRSDPRRFPGNESRSEPETVFQEELIRKLKPQKILSIHSPLNFMDYDGPDALSLERFPRDYVQRCLKLRKELKAISSGFFPGSLGNFAGQEMGVPTLTLELPTANSGMAYRYWLKFQQGIRAMIEFAVPVYAENGM